jgi:hypothetical protein
MRVGLLSKMHTVAVFELQLQATGQPWRWQMHHAPTENYFTGQLKSDAVTDKPCFHTQILQAATEEWRVRRHMAKATLPLLYEAAVGRASADVLAERLQQLYGFASS